MYTDSPRHSNCVLPLLALLLWLAWLGEAGAQPTAISYQGQLASGGQAVSGSYDLRFRLYDAATAGSAVGPVVTIPAVAVKDGVFSVDLDFGSGAFDGSGRWLEIAVRAAGDGEFTLLNPRQRLTAAPYAVYAMTPGGPKGDPGAPGPRGGVGPAGPVGPVGPKGDPGAAGAPGAAGPKGDPGVAGAVGATGPKGDPGAAGPRGEVGPAGPRGPTGPRGDVGPVGPSGPAGPVGPAGVDGRTVLNGAGEPARELGQEGDFYVDSKSTLLYGPKTGDGWGKGVNLVGLQGPQGAQGVQGEPGIPGVAGAKGDKGDRGDQGPQGLPGLQGPAGSADGWSRSGNAGTDPSVNFIGTTDAQPVELRANNQRILRLDPPTDHPDFGPRFASANWLAGSPANVISNGFVGASILGGGVPISPNVAGGHYATVIGGYGNKAINDFATVMGAGNLASGIASTAMGSLTWASGGASTALGQSTAARGQVSTAMGNGTAAMGRYSTAMGYQANAFHDGSFVWADSTSAVFVSAGENTFNVRAWGGAWFETAGNGLRVDGRPVLALDNGRLGVGEISPSFTVDVIASQAVTRLTTTNNANGSVLTLRNTSSSPAYLGAINFENTGGTPGQIGYLSSDHMAFRVGNAERMSLAAGGLTVNGTFVSSSDRNVKQDFAPVDAQATLAKVASLPLHTWSYTNSPSIRHVGPMAQDFHAAFGVGPDDRHIATVDADGVALAAIQGLNQKLERALAAQAELLEAQENRIAELESRLARLEQRTSDSPVSNTFP